jgi:hypothetical protein
MKKRFLGIVAVLFMVSSLVSANNNIVRIELVNGKSDVLILSDVAVSKAVVYGTKEDIIHFLINDEYIEHNLSRGIIYRFLFALDSISKPHGISKRIFAPDSNAILIVANDSSVFDSVCNTVYDDSSCKRLSPDILQLGKVNDLNVYISRYFNDTLVFPFNTGLVKVDLNGKHTDAFQVEGKPYPEVSVFGSRENIIRFLINDKYVRHNLDEGSEYSFKSGDNMQKALDYFSSSSNADRKILIYIKDKNEFEKIYKKLKKEEDLIIANKHSFELNDIDNMKIHVFTNGKAEK